MKTTLETPRVLLREFVPEDDVELYELDSDPQVMSFMPTDATPLQEIREVMLPRRFADYRQHPGLGFWAAIDRETGAFMGWFHFRPYQGDVRHIEIGYRLKRIYWGRGIATEVSEAMVERAFAMPNVERVVAEAARDNAVSIRVMEKVGLRVIDNRADANKVVYGLTREEWKA